MSVFDWIASQLHDGMIKFVVLAIMFFEGEIILNKYFTVFMFIAIVIHNSRYIVINCCPSGLTVKWLVEIMDKAFAMVMLWDDNGE